MKLMRKSKSSIIFAFIRPRAAYLPKAFDNQLSKYRFAQTNKKYNLKESRFYPTQKKHYASALEHITTWLNSVFALRPASPNIKLIPQNTAYLAK
jgi:hypothetical protein